MLFTVSFCHLLFLRYLDLAERHFSSDNLFRFRDLSNLYSRADWEDFLKIDELNASNSTKMYLDKLNMLLDTYLPLKIINKYKLKFKPKREVTLVLQKAISVKNKSLKFH